MFLSQRKLLYHPDTYASDLLAKEAAAEGLHPWPDRAGYRGLLAEPRTAPARGTILHLHGNAGSALDWSDLRLVTRPLGYRLILLEYPGYGARSGGPGEKTLASDAAESIRLARAQFGAPLFLFGESLGSGVAAAAVAATGREIDGVLLATPWDDLPHVAQAIFWFLPVKWLVRDRWDSVRNLAGYAGPVVVVMAGRDELIPNRCTERLFASLGGSKQMQRLDLATHNTWRDHTAEAWWQEVMGFLHGGASDPIP